jgi:GNAT superfamily N-acetyltransferase
MAPVQIGAAARPELVHRAYDHPDARALVGGLHADQLARYGHAEDPRGDDAAAFRPPDGLFLVGYLHGDPVGCGGFRRYDAETTEIKRMFVRPEYRGRGHGAHLLGALERAAAHAGARRLILETGAKNLAACDLYVRFGYYPIPGYSANRHSGVNRAFARDLAPVGVVSPAAPPRGR